jgi:RNA polymerase sigma-70 factor (ECF subfamily)
MAQATDQAAAEVTDELLVRQTLSGHRESFSTLVRRYQRQAHAVAFNKLNNTHDAQEVTQNAFVNAYQKLPSLEQPAAFGGWLMRIVNNLSLNYRRGRAVRSSLSLDQPTQSDPDSPDLAQNLPQHTPGPTQLAEGKELGQALQQAMALLTPTQRATLEMFTLENLSQQQIATKLNMTVANVKWHIFSARKVLKQTLEGKLNND